MRAVAARSRWSQRRGNDYGTVTRLLTEARLGRAR